VPLFYRETWVALLAMRATGFRLSATRRPHLVAITVARTEATLSGRYRMKCRLVERRPHDRYRMLARGRLSTAVLQVTEIT
jgi:hypothetical protein